MSMLYRQCIQLSLNLILASIQSCYFISLTFNFTLQLLYPLFKQLLLRLNIPCFFFLLFNYPLQLLLELYLQLSYPLVIFRLHLDYYSLIHIYHTLQSILDSIPLSLQIIYLIAHYLVFTFQISYFADFLF